MQTVMEQRSVTTSGTLESATFSIKANGKAFKVLIDGLYSNKPLAVIRELWSNAYDSHREADKADVPFLCQLPTVWDSQFRVRDYGVSMSHDGVMRLYTTVFESTKEDTNNQVGKLGLGSKSPFAYTDTFTVTTWKDGEKRMYSAYIGEDYIPRISHMGTEPSDEPQGLEVSFPVRSEDIDKFEDAARTVRQGFDVQPVIEGVDLGPLTDDMGTVLYSGDGWKLYSDLDHALARQGCVVYPLDPYAVDGLSEASRALMRAGLYIDFPIGDLEIAASREALGYDKPTCANIVKMMDRVEAELRAQFAAELSQIKSRWELAAWANKISATLPRGVRDVLLKGTHKHMPITKTFSVNWFRLKSRSRQTFLNATIHTYRFTRRGKAEANEAHDIHVDPTQTKFFVQFLDGPKISAVKLRIDTLLRELAGDRSHCYFIRCTKAQWKRLYVAFGRPATWTDVATLPEPPKEAVARTKVRVQEYVNGSWVRVDVTAEDGGIYVAKERGDWMTCFGPGSKSLSEHAASRMVADLRDLGVLGPQDRVFAVPATLRRFVKDATKWLKLTDLVEEVVDQNYDEAKAQRFADLQTTLENYHIRTGWPRFLSDPETQTLTLDGTAARLQRLLRDLHAEYATLKACGPYKDLAARLGRPTPVGRHITAVTAAVRAFEEVYPLLASVGSEPRTRPAALDYIYLIDMREHEIDRIAAEYETQKVVEDEAEIAVMLAAA